jgi:hypothetical protein
MNTVASACSRGRVCKAAISPVTLSVIRLMVSVDVAAAVHVGEMGADLANDQPARGAVPSRPRSVRRRWRFVTQTPNVFGYVLAIPDGKTVQSLTLPDNNTENIPGFSLV